MFVATSDACRVFLQTSSAALSIQVWDLRSTPLQGLYALSIGFQQNWQHQLIHSGNLAVI